LAYYNCIDGGRTISAGPDYSKCSDIQAIALAPAGTANFAKVLSAEQKVSGLVLERSVEEAAEGYANSLQGSAQMGAYLSAYHGGASAAAAAKLEAAMSQIESYTKVVCDAAAAAVSADPGAGSSSSSSSSSRAAARAAAVARHCATLPCTAQTRLPVKGAGCFGFTPGYVVNTNGLPLTDNLPDLTTAETYASKGFLQTREMGSTCGGDLTRMGEVLKYNGEDAYPAWPSATNPAHSLSGTGLFPTMAQITAGNSAISSGAWKSGSEQGNWEVEQVRGYDGLLSPPQLLTKLEDIVGGGHGHRPYVFSEEKGGKEALQLYVTQALRPLTLYTGSKLRAALEKEQEDIAPPVATTAAAAAAATAAPTLQPPSRLLRRSERKLPSTTETTAEGLYQPDGDMQVRVKGLTANRYAASRAELDATPGGAVPAGASGVVSLAYQNGFPAWLSLPLFLNTPAEAQLTEKVSITRHDGLRIGKDNRPPNSDWTLQIYLDVEPVTGATINAHKRLQASFAVPNIGAGVGVAATQLFTPAVQSMVITPVYYVDEHSTISDSKADTISTAIEVNSSVRLVLHMLAPVGAALFLAGVALFFTRRSAAAGEAVNATFGTEAPEKVKVTDKAAGMAGHSAVEV